MPKPIGYKARGAPAHHPPRTLDLATTMKELVTLSGLKDPVARVAPLWALTVVLQYLRHLGTPKNRDPALPDFPPPEHVPDALAVANLCEEALLVSMGRVQWPRHSLNDYRTRLILGPSYRPDLQLDRDLPRVTKRYVAPTKPKTPKSKPPTSSAPPSLPTAKTP